MVKSSKKKKKSKKTSSAPKQLNPFYIEESSSANAAWEGEWRHDTELDDEEQAAFINSDTSWRRDLPQRRTHHQNHHAPLLNYRMGATLLCVTLLFWILLAATGSRHVADETTKPDAAKIETTAPTASPSKTATLAPVAASTTEAPVASPGDDDTDDSLTIPIIVLGERHSGVEWLTEALKECYPQADIRFGFSRAGYFFQDFVPSTTARIYYAVRNPYDWFLNMQIHPMFAPDHKGLSLREFCHAPWGNKTTLSHGTCQQNFQSNQVTPCDDPDTELKDSTPVYELDEDGNVYSGLLKLRRDKIQQVFALQEHWTVAEFHIVPAENTGLNCTEDVPTFEDLPDIATESYLKWMHENIDWGTEKRIGYKSKASDEPW